jgi:hypothetical protein
VLPAFQSRLSHALKRRCQFVVNRLSYRNALRVHFIEMPAWEPQIRYSFRGAKHKLSFGRLTQEIAANCDLVVPLDMLGVLAANHYRPLLNQQIIPIPEKSVAILCDDKSAFNHRVIGLGYSENIPQMGADLNLPFMLKKRISASSNHVHRVCSEEDRSHFHEQINSPDYYCQLMVPGSTEYASHVLVKNGRILFDLTLKYLYDCEFPIKGKNPSTTTIVQSRHVRLFERILNDISYSGLCCFNYKELNGRAMIIEINPRFGGSLTNYFPSVLSAALRSK